MNGHLKLSITSIPVPNIDQSIQLARRRAASKQEDSGMPKINQSINLSINQSKTKEMSY